MLTHAGINQAKISEILGVSPGQISRWINGVDSMPQPTAMAIGAALGIRWQWLLHGEGAMLLDSVTAHMPEDLKKIADLWPQLTEKQRQYVLGVVRGVLAGGVE